MSETNFERLPNEIILNVFDYIDSIHLLQCFYGLNNRFKNLLYQQFLNYDLNLKNLTHHHVNMICKQHLPFIVDRIISLQLLISHQTLGQFQMFLSYANQLTRLQSLSITSFRPCYTLMGILDKCQLLSNLTYLQVHFYETHQIEQSFQLIVNHIWSLSKLIQCNIHLCIKTKSFFVLPQRTSQSIENLFIHVNELEFSQINRLFEFTPRLKNLSASIDFSFNYGYVPQTISSLLQLNLLVKDGPISVVIEFFRHLPNLRRLNICAKSTTLFGYQWEEIISTYLPNLKFFQYHMEHSLISVPDILKFADHLIKSYQRPFWTDKTQSSTQCFVEGNTIYLTSAFGHNINKFSRSFIFSDHHNDHQKWYTGVMYAHELTASNIHASNIEYLTIQFPSYDQFWLTVPTFNRLRALAILSLADIYHSTIQTLLDHAPNLHILNLYHTAPLPLQKALFHYRHRSIRELNFKAYNYYFNDNECVQLCHSSLGIQCTTLHIKVMNRESIVYLVKNMVSLLSLHVQCEDEKHYCQSTSANNNDELIQWLKNSLPSIRSIARNGNAASELTICI
ncbi:unnamed protein product [Adineta ricciae]|uniref:F-box domain-containing protein n=1 Tax=Adineta ricciae TaxID=249248 RepID=A0A815HI66_ADIRI|nr:unnamed protein product [Adineta ricciae]CAF1506426.1 unnamed protein product [Adineta ricciae]